MNSIMSGVIFYSSFVLSTWHGAVTQQPDTGFLDERINDPTVVASPLAVLPPVYLILQRT